MKSILQRTHWHYVRSAYFRQPVVTYTDSTGQTQTVYSAIIGLRNMTGVVNADGTVTIYAITGNTSIISGGEPDPTSLVSIGCSNRSCQQKHL